jgi:hypothetical protein
VEGQHEVNIFLNQKVEADLHIAYAREQMDLRENQRKFFLLIQLVLVADFSTQWKNNSL